MAWWEIWKNLDEAVDEARDPISLRNSVIGNEDNGLSSKVESQRDIKDYAVAASMSSIYTQVSSKRSEMIVEVDKLVEFYLTDAILNQFADDALSPDIHTGDVIKIYSKNKEINKKITELDKKIKFDNLVNGILVDLLSYGEYTLRPEYDDKKGIISIKDDVNQIDVIALSDINGEVIKYLVLEEGKFYLKEKHEYVKFSLSNKKIRINLKKEFGPKTIRENKKIFESIPNYIRIGRSVIYPVRSKLKELELLEKLVPATKLSKLSSGTVIGIQVPPGMDITKAMEATKKVEGLLNKKVGYDDAAKELSVENIMAVAGKLKCVPIFGDKGQLTKLDYKADEPDDLLASVEENRRTICNSAGIPYELIFGSDGEQGAGSLKRYARYLRKLKAIQRSICEGVIQIVCFHLANSGVTFVESDICVEFRNKLIEIDNLDKLEFMDTTVNMLNNIVGFVLDKAGPDSPLKGNIDLNALVRFMDTQLSTVGLQDLIKEDVKVVMDEPESEDDLDSID
jgi:hypothetical protein